MMPPTAGGPATHAKRLVEHFGYRLFNFEKYKKFPSGIRHLFAFIDIFFKSFDNSTILALDGFTVALPSIFVGKLLRKKVILRVGGDFIYENFLYTKEVNFEEFYNNFAACKKIMPIKLYLKYLVQKLIMQNADGIIFNTEWQKNIFAKHYNLKQNLFVVENPVEPIGTRVFDNAVTNNNFENALQDNKFIFTSITRDIPYKNQRRVKEVFEKISMGIVPHFEHKQGTHESCLKRISLSRAYICASISDISPNQVQEAISLKIPVIISKYTGITKILKEAGVARVVDPFDLEDIEQAILEMCDDEKYLKYKNNLEKFVWPQTWNTLFAQYESILSEKL